MRFECQGFLGRDQVAREDLVEYREGTGRQGTARVGQGYREQQGIERCGAALTVIVQRL